MLHQSYLDLFESDNPPVLPVRFVVSVSSGASSAVAAQRVLDRYGHDNVDLVFADTLEEDSDNYRFLEQLEKLWGKKCIRLVDGRTPQEVWDDKSLIPSDQFAPCTYELKLKLIIDYAKQLHQQGYAVIMCIGYSPKDLRRPNKQAADKIRKQLIENGWNESRVNETVKRLQKRFPGRLLSTAWNWSHQKLAYVEYPCLWRPVDFDVNATIKAWGIELPRMYEMGFTSANCSGGCPKGGLDHWRRTLTHMPEMYAKREAWEKQKRASSPVFANRTILTRTIKGETIPVTLEQIRTETQSAKPEQLRLFTMLDDMANVCTTSECGVGWDDIAEAA